MEEEGWRGEESSGKAGRGEGSTQHCYFLFGSHSLSAPIPDRWREGRAGAKRLSPQACRAGGGCFVSMVCVGRGSSWWSGCLASLEPVPQELGGGLCVDVVGQESGQGVSLTPASTGCALALPTKDRCALFTGCWGWAGALGTGTELWPKKGLGQEASGSQAHRVGLKQDASWASTHT